MSPVIISRRFSRTAASGIFNVLPGRRTVRVRMISTTNKYIRSMFASKYKGILNLFYLSILAEI
jgi:hypothetical protein